MKAEVLLVEPVVEKVADAVDCPDAMDVGICG
jgi:hypothetical protein